MRDDNLLVSGFAENPEGPAIWIGGSFLSCGRSAFGKSAASLHCDDPASQDEYWDNWLCNKQRQWRRTGSEDPNFFKLTQDVPRGGPHPKVSTTLPPQGGVEKLRFGSGFCPDVGGLFGDLVSSPELILSWNADLMHGVSLECH